MVIQENFSLQAFTSFGVNAQTQYFAEISNLEDLKSVLIFSKEKSINLLFLGGGSNILFTKDFEGLVVKIALKGIEDRLEGENSVLVTASAGENWQEFIQYCLGKNYGGLENLSLIPGNVGTSPIQNIGAYGTEIKDVFVSCTVLNTETLEMDNFDGPSCRFGYRDSIFKQEGKGKFIILDVTFRLTTTQHKISIEYGAIQSELEKINCISPTIIDIANAVVAIRQSKLPDPKKIGNAGSFFKNPTISLEFFNELKSKFPTISGYPNGNVVKIAAGWLIEQAGWKGRQIGNVACHHLQALVIINKTGNATGKEIFDFSTKIILSVEEKFGIILEREVNIL